MGVACCLSNNVWSRRPPYGCTRRPLARKGAEIPVGSVGVSPAAPEALSSSRSVSCCGLVCTVKPGAGVVVCAKSAVLGGGRRDGGEPGPRVTPTSGELLWDRTRWRTLKARVRVSERHTECLCAGSGDVCAGEGCAVCGDSLTPPPTHTTHTARFIVAGRPPVHTVCCV